MRKSVVLGKLNLIVVLVRTGVPLVLTGLIIGLVIGFLVGPDAEGGSRWIVVLKSSLLLGLQGLALALVLTLMAALYNFFVSLAGGINFSADDRDEK